mmetsp:Transcript_11021/g.45747  ORF Transcript_11021/g.45747 Transcript_11021/m.45747 type:complete len:297 (-) Transcript_11021:56-946(-)
MSSSRFSSLPTGRFRACTRRIASRARRSGSSTGMMRSMRPLRTSASSRVSTRLVAPSTKMLSSCVSKPSISTKSWMRPCSRSSTSPAEEPRARPMASISSMKTMHGACARARANRSRTRAAATPTNISTNSEPLAEKNGTPASFAIALARYVLPVPGGPTSSTPLGRCTPAFLKRSSPRSALTRSFISDTTLSRPATSLKLTPVSASARKRALVLPASRATWLLDLAPFLLRCQSAHRSSTFCARKRPVSGSIIAAKLVASGDTFGPVCTTTVAPLLLTMSMRSYALAGISTLRIW